MQMFRRKTARNSTSTNVEFDAVPVFDVFEYCKGIGSDSTWLQQNLFGGGAGHDQQLRSSCGLMFIDQRI